MAHNVKPVKYCQFFPLISYPSTSHLKFLTGKMKNGKATKTTWKSFLFSCDHDTSVHKKVIHCEMPTFYRCVCISKSRIYKPIHVHLERIKSTVKHAIRVAVAHFEILIWKQCYDSKPVDIANITNTYTLNCISACARMSICILVDKITGGTIKSFIFSNFQLCSQHQMKHSSEMRKTEIAEIGRGCRSYFTVILLLDFSSFFRIPCISSCAFFRISFFVLIKSLLFVPRIKF